MPKEVVYKPVEKFKQIYAGGTLAPPKFMPTYYEWLSMRSQRIIKEKTLTSSSDAGLYVVPRENTLFLISVFCDIVSTGAAAQKVGDIYIGTTTAEILLNTEIKAAEGRSANSLSFKIPLMVRSGESIRTSLSAANSNFSCGFVGFLVKNSDVFNF